MKVFGLLALGLSSACGGASSAVVPSTSPIAAAHAALAASTEQSCTSVDVARPADCPASSVKTASSSDDVAIRGAAWSVRAELFDHERESANAARTFARSETDASNEERDAALARALADIDARARCGDPELGQPEWIADAAGDLPLVFFSGSTPTDAGGVGDLATWGLLAVRNGCDWKRVDIRLTASPLQRFRDPNGRRVLTQSRVVDQCAEEVRAFVVEGVKPELLLAMRQSRRDMVDSGVCPDARKVEPIESSGILQGFRTMDCTDEDACKPIEEAHFRGGSLVVNAKPSSSPEEARSIVP